MIKYLELETKITNAYRKKVKSIEIFKEFYKEYRKLLKKEECDYHYRFLFEYCNRFKYIWYADYLIWRLSQ